MNRQARAFGIIVASGLLLSGALLAAPQQETEYLILRNLTGTRGGNLVAALDSDPPSFNRMMATGIAHSIVTDRISGDLVHVNRATFELEPALATNWEVSKDGRVYTVHLRHGLRFSDGSACDADDVIFTMQALQDPKTGSPLADQVKIDGVFPTFAKVDSHTIKITFQRAVGMGLRMFDTVPILPRARLLKEFQDGRFGSALGPDVQPGEVVGLGPFRLKEYQRGVKIVLERNPYYWKKDKTGQPLPYLDSIIFLLVKDRNAEALRFQAGELDLLNSVSPENYALLRRSQGQSQYVVQDLGPGLRIDFLWFNLNSGADRAAKARVDPEKQALFENSEFRRAVSLALDRGGIARAIYLGLATPQFGPISSGNKPWYDPKVPQPAMDAEGARKILAQLGLTDSNGDGIVEFGAKRRPLEVSILTASGVATRERAAQVVRDNLTKIGIRAEVQLVPRNELITRILNSFDYEAVLFGFGATDVIPEALTDVWYSSAKNHFWHPGQEKPHRQWEAEIDSLTTRLIQSIDPAARRAAFYNVQQIWVREMPSIPLIAENVLVAWKSRVGNIRPSILAPAPQLLWNAEELTIRGR
jgi:peptide/nickel transport system substrate-binding protein